MATTLFRRHDAASHAAYQELKQLARTQRRILSGTPGTLKQRTQSGRRYWVREHIRVDGRKVDEYLGAEAALDAARVDAARAEVELARALAAGSAKLRLLGFQRIERKPAAVLEVFFNRGLLQADLVPVSSHAFGALLNELGVRVPGSETEDIEVAGHPGVGAQTIPLLDFLIKEPIDGVVLSPNQVVPVGLPAPERFVLHKLFSSQSRKSDRDKIAKDLDQAAVLAAALEEQTPELLQDTFRRMPASGKERVRRGARAAARKIEGRHAQGEAALHKIGRQ